MIAKKHADADGAALLAEIRRSARSLARRERVITQARQDLRLMMRAALDRGVSTRQVAEAAGVSQPRIVQLTKEREEDR